MIRADFQRASEPVTFTSRPFQLPKLAQIRLVDENDNQEVNLFAFQEKNFDILVRWE